MRTFSIYRSKPVMTSPFDWLNSGYYTERYAFRYCFLTRKLKFSREQSANSSEL